MIKKSESEPPTRKDFKVKVSQNGLPINIIMDGVLMKENVEIAGIDDKFIMKCISKANLSKVKDVLIMTLDNNGEVFVQGRDADECFNFQMKFNGGDRW